MTTEADTIFAPSTPPGVGALAVVRISGPGVRDVLAALTLSRTARRGDPGPSAVPKPMKIPDKALPFRDDVPKEFSPRGATLARLFDPLTGDELDRALVTFFPSPHSFTGEDVAELSLHGGRAVVSGVIAALSALPGTRLAEPGEFTRRAFLNHKVDLTEAESIADLIHAETVLQRTQALAQLGGALKNLYDGWRDQLIHIAAYVEAHLDFPDEDLPQDLMARALPKIKALAHEIAAHLDDKGRGEVIREGVNVVILGAPNVGKSSLLNALARREVAIVSPHAGTTRDLIDVHLDVSGYPVTLTDTAGLRPGVLGNGAQDQIEAIGIERALSRADASHMKIVMFDAQELPELDPHALAQIDENTIIVVNKVDQAPAWPETIAGKNVVGLSVQTGRGIEDLVSTLGAELENRFGAHEGATLTRARHRAALTECAAALSRAAHLSEVELVAEELRVGVAALGRLTGRVDVEDLLDVIFRDFCIGK